MELSPALQNDETRQRVEAKYTAMKARYERDDKNARVEPDSFFQEWANNQAFFDEEATAKLLKLIRSGGIRRLLKKINVMLVYCGENRLVSAHVVNKDGQSKIILVLLS